MEPLVVSHMASVNALGRGVAATRDAVLAMRSGLAPNDFTADRLDGWIGRVAGVENDPVAPHLARYDSRNNRLAGLALREDGFEAAVARLRERFGASRIGVFVGTSTSGILETELGYRARPAPDAPLPASVSIEHQQNVFSAAAYVRDHLGLAGPTLAVSTACSSSAKVFAQAARHMAAGFCDAAVVGGVDSLCYTTLYGFHSLQLFAPNPCRPCAPDRNGISIGEAAGFAILERRAPAADEIVLRGWGESSDAHHMSSPDPDGAGAEAAMRAALGRAGLDPAAIDYVEMHGTGTQANDVVEDMAIARLFGDRPAVSSTKGWTGHTLGAAGIVNAIIAAIALREQVVPGTLNTQAIDPAIRSRVLVANALATVRNVVTNAFGFGGSNASLVFGRADG